MNNKVETRISIDRLQRAFLNDSKITIVEFSEFDEKNKCWLSSKTWINGWLKRHSLIIKKIAHAREI